MTPPYETFLASKRRAAADAGIGATSEALHSSLFPFQQDVTTWALRKGRAALFLDAGLGKTRCQVEWARLIASRSLIIAPLSVARQTVRESERIDVDVRYVRSPDHVTGPGVWITNYEMADRFDPSEFDAVVLDESSILKNATGITRNALIQQWDATRYRLCCTATPAPNDQTELTNHAEFLGLMSRREMLASYFVHDDEGWRLKGHAAKPMYQWMASWAVAAKRPSDLGYPDTGYELPPLTIKPEVVDVKMRPEGQLFATDLGGIGGRFAVRKQTLGARVDRATEIASGDGQWIIWCGLNEEADRISRDTKGAVNVEGSMAPEAKAEAMEAFQDGEIRVLVSKPSICGAGMNFQQCSQMVFCGLSDSWEQYYQAIRRCWRFGQTKPVDVRIVVSELEQQIVENIRRKEEESEAMTAALVAEMGRAR